MGRIKQCVLLSNGQRQVSHVCVISRDPAELPFGPASRRSSQASPSVYSWHQQLGTRISVTDPRVVSCRRRTTSHRRTGNTSQKAACTVGRRLSHSHTRKELSLTWPLPLPSVVFGFRGSDSHPFRGCVLRVPKKHPRVTRVKRHLVGLSRTLLTPRYSYYSKVVRLPVPFISALFARAVTHRPAHRLQERKPGVLSLEHDDYIEATQV